jgi:ABC-type lipoprotein export system ATPase subunit
MNRWVYNISFGYSTEKLFFDKVTFECNSNKLNVIVGKNGVGKSTLFNVLQGKISEQNYVNGSLIINNEVEKNIADKKTLDFIYSKVHLVAQDFKSMLAMDFTVKENIEMASINYIPYFGSCFKQLKYVEILEKIEIDLHKLAKELSGGQQQLLSIIMSLQKDTSVLLLDEPTSALDDENCQLLILFLKELALKYHIIVIMILHDTELIKQYKNDLNINEIYKDSNQERHIKPIHL